MGLQNLIFLEGQNAQDQDGSSKRHAAAPSAANLAGRLGGADRDGDSCIGLDSPSCSNFMCSFAANHRARDSFQPLPMSNVAVVGSTMYSSARLSGYSFIYKQSSTPTSMVSFRIPFSFLTVSPPLCTHRFQATICIDMPCNVVHTVMAPDTLGGCIIYNGIGGSDKSFCNAGTRQSNMQ
ncbi:hypothetical protein Cob_v004979 [Colletotrichum orbiculare MAFF 240422]|uniref:Uncharacterized protein n=1 Tax=Colletotrichum orbiculare (strain 104-T / ATCC 96160 / CBS 514.97 / LARS 414 / MAFF 240422) TaxID=1213857 RepID=A0A484FW93_COLOR|nr:hypothetical protein Cob_v004979 [Colletotrichum orbiculare MAFF 240422]